MIKKKMLLLLTCCALMGGGPTASAEKEDPPKVRSTSANQAIASFAKAYEVAGRPRMLVLCGADSRALELTAKRDANKGADRNPQAPAPEGPVATGVASEAHFVGANLSSFEPTGDAVLLKSSIEEILRGNRDLDLVDVDANTEVETRELMRLTSSGDQKAARQLQTKTNADLVLVIRLMPAPSGASRYRVTVDTLRLEAGRKIGGFAFEWREGTSAEQIKEYAAAVTGKFIRQFVDFYAEGAGGPPVTYTVKIKGIENLGDLMKARNAFKKIPGVKSVDDRGWDASEGGTLTIRYPGPKLDLVYELQEAARQQLPNLLVSGVRAGDGPITLAVSLKPIVRPVPLWRILTDPEHPRYKEKLDEFTRLYERNGSPQIAVLVNPALAANERSDPKIAQELRNLAQQAPATMPLANPPTTGPTTAESRDPTHGSAVFITLNLAQGGGAISGGNAGNAGTDPRNGAATTRPSLPDPATRPGAGGAAGNRAVQIDTQVMESLLVRSLGSLRVRQVDPGVAKANLERQIGKTRTVFRDNELAALLGFAADAKIVITGIGSLERKATGSTLHYAFRAVRAADGQMLGAENASLNFPPGQAIEEKAMRETADFVAGSLAEQMENAWEVPSTLTVQVHNAKTIRDVMAVMTFFQENVPGVKQVSLDSHEAGREGGVGIFIVRYTTSFDDLHRKAQELQKAMPFDIDQADANRGLLSVKIHDGV